ncbi:MAG TPA: BT_3928 family protein [Bacteroidales bacterium]|nr:BT_3928 family protein [Bacteroidales bacterium]
MKILLTISRIIVGAVFIFSGIVKAIDPMGSAYKFQDYFTAFNLDFLKGAGLILAILLCTVEFIAGFSVLTGIKQRTGIVLVNLLMLVFTPLTLVLAITNPVTDCGCFGDAIHLTNWQTFGKNVVLISFTSVLFFNRKIIKPDFSGKGLAIISAATLAFLIFAFYNLRFLPVIDFLPYKKGVRIKDEMVIPEGAKPDRYETTFIYEKNGVAQEFSLTDYPADDTTWKFIDQKSVLVEKGYEPPIHDFTLTSELGEDMTDNILSYNGNTLFMIVKKFDEADPLRLSEGFDYGRYCLDNGIAFYVLTASGSDETSGYQDEFELFSVDETTLKTIVRSNPGYMLISNGVIQGKWSPANLPDKEWFIKK